MAESELERVAYFQIRALGLPPPEREVMLIEGRKFRSDFVWRDAKLVAEVDGGTDARGEARGRHVRTEGYESDAVKQNELACLGYRTLKLTRKMVESGEGVAYIERILGA